MTVTGDALGTPRTVVTDDQGRYELRLLPPGRYVVQATLAGFEPWRAEVDVGADDATLDVALAVAPLVERLTVTATKTGAAEIQSTPIAITALSARTLEQLGARNIEGLAGFVPTLTIAQHTGLAQVTIRGIGSNAVFAGSDPEHDHPSRRHLSRAAGDGVRRLSRRGARRSPARSAGDALRAQLCRRHDQHRHPPAHQHARDPRAAHCRQLRHAARRRRRQRSARSRTR